MDKIKVTGDEVLKIITERKERPNKDLEVAMQFIQTDFEQTKENLLKLSNHLDKLENTYNLILKEHSTRNGVK